MSKVILAVKESLRMKRKWEATQVEDVHSILPSEEYNQILEELAEMVYRYLCQLQENQSEAPELLQRTGTDG